MIMMQTRKPDDDDDDDDDDNEQDAKDDRPFRVSKRLGAGGRPAP